MDAGEFLNDASKMCDEWLFLVSCDGEEIGDAVGIVVSTYRTGIQSLVDTYTFVEVSDTHIE